MNIVKFNKKHRKEINNNNNNNQELIEKLEFLLNLAKNGHLQALVGIIISDNNEMENLYSGDIDNDYLGIMGMLSDLQIELKQIKDGKFYD